MFSGSLGKGVAGAAFAGAIESDDAALGIEHDDQRANRIEDCGNNVAFFLQRFFRLLQVGDVEPDAVNEPRAAIVAPDHLGFAMKPDHAAIARKHAIGRPQRLAR